MRLAAIIAGLVFILAACSCLAKEPNKAIQSKNGHSQITLPDGWVEANLRSGRNKISAKCDEKAAYVLVIAEAKVDLPKDKTAEDYAARILKIEQGKKALEHQSLSAAKKLKIHGYPAVQYELTGTLKSNGVRIKYLKTFVALPTQFCQVICWTTQSRFDECRSDFDAVTGSVDEPGGREGAKE